MPRAASILLLLTALVARINAQPLVVYFGDSITEGWMDAVRRPADAYPAVCDTLVRERHVSARNLSLGFAGETTDDALTRLESGVLALRPDVVVVAFGSNDYYIHGHATTPRVSLQRFAANLRLIVQRLRGGGVQPVLLGLPPLIASRYAAYSDPRLYAPYGGASAHNRSYDSTLRTVAAETHTPIVPLPWDSLGDAALLGIDGVHPTPAGHRDIAVRLLPAVLAAIDAGAPPIAASEKIDVYPQPFDPRLHGRLVARCYTDKAGPVDWELLDAHGARVSVVTSTAAVPGELFAMWNADHLRAGWYVVHLRGTRQYKECIIVQ